MDRRTFIAALGTATTASLAGCGSASATPRPPNVPEERIESGGWERQDRMQETVLEREFPGGITLTATATTELYEDAQLAAEIEEKTLGQISGQMAMFFASRVTMSPNLADLPAGVGQKEIVDQVSTQSRATFESQLRNVGLQDVSQESTGQMEVGTGETADTTTYTAVFPFDSITFPVTDSEQIEIEGGEMSVAGELAVWIHDGGINVAGGAYPSENFAESVQRDLSSAISVSVDIDLGLTPDEYAAEVDSLVKAVE